MAMGMHTPPPIPRLRRACCSSSFSSPPPSSPLVECIFYRGHFVNCAVLLKTSSNVPVSGSTALFSMDKDWQRLYDRSKGVPVFGSTALFSMDKDWQRLYDQSKNEYTKRKNQRACSNVMESATTFSGRGGLNDAPPKEAVIELENTKGHDVANHLAEAGGGIQDSTSHSHAGKLMFSSLFPAYRASVNTVYGEANRWQHFEQANNLSISDGPASLLHRTRSSRVLRDQLFGALGGKGDGADALSEHHDTDAHFAVARDTTKHLDRDRHLDPAVCNSGLRNNRDCNTQENVSPQDTREVVDVTREITAEIPSKINDSSGEVKELANSVFPEKAPVQEKEAQLACSIEDVIIVDNTLTARTVIKKLRTKYRHLIHACDTEVADIDVKKESPVGHGRVICFSIYCGPSADFGGGKSCIWVDLLDSDLELLDMFREYFEDSSIKKVWHNFSFDRHVLANHGIRVAGFYADTMQLARLWHSGRKAAEGSYSLESLTSDVKAMNGVHNWDAQSLSKKTSMMDLFGYKKLKKDGTEGSIKVIPPVEELQRSETLRERWICYSSGDALCTWRLWESLHGQLSKRDWFFQNKHLGSMYTLYDTYWRPFGELLAEMEGHGMLVDRDYLSEIEKIACKERAVSISRFRKWVAKYCPYADYVNVTSDAQIRQLLFGGFHGVSKCRSFKVPNIDGYIEEGKKAPLKYRTIDLCGIGVELPCDAFTSGGLPAVSMQALKNLAGKVVVDLIGTDEEEEFIPEEADVILTSAGIKAPRELEEQIQEDLSAYGQAYQAFKGGQEGKDACRAIAALCEISAIDTLISGFIQPLQGGDIMGPHGRVHCSLNLNTETGRLSARRPNLQNQPALEKDRYKIRQAFIASPGNSLIVADYGQLELRLLAHLADCKSMLEAFRIGGDFHSRTAMNMYTNVRAAVEKGQVLLEWEPKPGEDCPPVPLLKDVYAAERRKAKMLNFSIAYGKTARGLSKDWKVSLQEAQETLKLWYRDRPEVRKWQEAQKKNARENQCVYTLLGRARHFPDVTSGPEFLRGRIDRAAINTPVQGSAADVAMLAMLEIWRNVQLKDLGWKLLLQVHDEVILEGPAANAARAKDLVVQAMSCPFGGTNILKVDLVVDAKYANSWYAAK